MSASNNPCTSSFVSESAYFYSMDRRDVRFSSFTNDAQITALCSTSGVSTTATPPGGGGPSGTTAMPSIAAAATLLTCGQTERSLSVVPVDGSASQDFRMELPTVAVYKLYSCGSFGGRYASYVAVYGPIRSDSGEFLYFCLAVFAY